MFIRYALSLLVVVLVGAGCSSDHTTAPDGGAAEFESAINGIDYDNLSAESFGVDGYGSHRTMSFVVRIENVSSASTLKLSNGETAPVPHAPGVWTVSKYANTLFTAGRLDNGKGLEELAEDGNPEKLAYSLKESRVVSASGVFNTPVGDAGPGPATPGKAYQFTITAAPGDRLSFATMFVQSNDLFYAPRGAGIPLFLRGNRPIRGDITRLVELWDAGTEVNQEPGLGADQAPRQSGPDTGDSERKRIRQIRENGRWSRWGREQFTYPSTEEVIKVTIMPIESIQSSGENSSVN